MDEGRGVAGMRRGVAGMRRGVAQMQHIPGGWQEKGGLHGGAAWMSSQGGGMDDGDGTDEGDSQGGSR